MPDHSQFDALERPRRPISVQLPQLPWWVARRLLQSGERVTWVRGPRFNPFWERYATHPGLFIAALVVGAICFPAGRVIAGEWTTSLPMAFAIAAGLAIGSIFVLAISATYFTRLVVTDYRIVILQGFEICRSWSLDDLPYYMIRYTRSESGKEVRSVDLEAMQTVLGEASDQFVEAKTIRRFGRKLEQIRADDDDRTHPLD